MLSCVWFVTFKNSWERSMLGCVASELRALGFEITIYADGGTEGFENLNALSWGSLRPTEKFFIIGGKGKLWHLWEGGHAKIPKWWSIIRARARTMHTKLENSGTWHGHPSLLLRSAAKSGESIIPPAIEATVSGVDWLPDVEEMTFSEATVSNAIFAAYASLQGIKVVVPQSEIFDELLGIDGGGGNSSSARRHIQEKFHPSESAKKISILYKKILGKNEERA